MPELSRSLFDAVACAGQALTHLSGDLSSHADAYSGAWPSVFLLRSAAIVRGTDPMAVLFKGLAFGDSVANIDRFQRMAVLCIGEALTDLGNVLLQGERSDNMLKLGGIASGFERAAAYARGVRYEAVVDPKHVGSTAKQPVSS